MAEYASKAVAGTALGLSIGSAALSTLTGAGGLAGVLGIGPRNPAPMDPGDRPVTRYELDLIQQINAKNDEITGFKAAQYTDVKAEALQAQISQAVVFNATSIETMKCLQKQIDEVRGITRVVVPNQNIDPGWGPVIVAPIQPQQVQTPASSGGSTATGG